jgi:hypothetical protein
VSADLNAAKAAVEKGIGDEAIQLFTQALAAGDLSADDQLVARSRRSARCPQGHGPEYDVARPDRVEQWFAHWPRSVSI